MDQIVCRLGLSIFCAAAWSLASAAELSADTAEIWRPDDPAVTRIRIVELADNTWQVELVIPTGGMDSLELREFRHSHDQCPEIEYVITQVDHATRDEAAALEERRVFRPDGEDRMRISYTVRAAEKDFRSVSQLAGCSALLSDQSFSLLDGGALLLALRPTGLDQAPYRFGPTVLEYSGQNAANARISAGVQIGPDQWQAERADAFRFAFIATGNWRFESARESSPPRLTIGAAASEEINTAKFLPVLDRFFDQLIERWGGLDIGEYTIFLTPTNAVPGSFGEYSGAAYPQSSVLHRGHRVSDRTLTIGLAHEIAHLWIPAQLGPVSDAAWIGEGLVELVSHIELINLGFLPEAYAISRINRAAYNLVVNEADLQQIYDQGLLSWIIASPDLANPAEVQLNPITDVLREERHFPLTPDRFWAAAGRPELVQFANSPVELLRHLPCQLRVSSKAYALVEGEWPEYQTGWILSGAVPGEIAALEANSPADRSGLREGDLIAHIDAFGYGNLHHPITVHFVRDGVPDSVTFRPLSEDRFVQLPQYVEHPDPAVHHIPTRCQLHSR